MPDTRPVSRLSNLTGARAAPALKQLVVAVALTLGGVQLACAGPLPDGQNVVQGSATVTTPTGNSMLVNVTSNKAVINWNGFSVASGNQVQFVQPSASAVTLNRVTGGAASNIDGSLLANGQLFLVNQNGVFFGAGAQVNVGGLIASTLDISDSNFMAGTYDFAKVGGSPTGQVVNNATITVGSRGYAALLGEQVSNGADGVIIAPLGKIVLAAGERVSVNLANDQLLSFSVDPSALASGGYVQNAGQLLADGGTVMLTARVTNALAGAVVNQGGLIRAQGVVEKNGEVYLSADGGDIEVSGTIEANAQGGAHGGTIGLAANGGNVIVAGSGVLQAKGTVGGVSDGGTINISGNRIELRGQVDASRSTGGSLGTVALTAGDLSIGQGTAPLDAACTVPGTCASIYQQDAQAILRGANLTMTATRAIGNASLRVGDLSANGGSGMIDGRNAGAGGALKLNAVAINGAAEVRFDNTANSIHADGNLNVSARGGIASDVNVGALSAAHLDLRATMPTYVPGVSTSGTISAGNLTASAAGDTGITMVAAGRITLNGDATAQSGTGVAMLNFSGDAINLGSGTVAAIAPLVAIANINSGNVAVTQAAGGVLRTSTTATALESANAGGAYSAVTVGGQGSHQLAGTLEALAGGDLSMASVQVGSSTGSLTLGQVSARAGNNGYTANVNLSAAGNISTTGTLESYAAAGPGSLSVSAGGAVQFGGNVTLQGVGSDSAVLATVNAGTGNLGMAAGTQISVTDSTAAGQASQGAGLAFTSGQGTVQVGNLAVASTTGAAQAQINGNAGVALNGNVAVSGQSAVVTVSAAGNGTDISLATGKTVTAASNTAGGGGALVNIDNPNGTLNVPRGSLNATAPTGDVAGVITNPVIAAPAPDSIGNTSGDAAAVAQGPGQSLLSRLLGMARSTPVNPLANSGLIVMPAWNIVPRTVYSGGGIDAALFDEEGTITPTSEIIIDADPVNAAMKK